MAASTPSGKGKKASEASTDPRRAGPPPCARRGAPSRRGSSGPPPRPRRISVPRQHDRVRLHVLRDAVREDRAPLEPAPRSAPSSSRPCSSASASAVRSRGLQQESARRASSTSTSARARRRPVGATREQAHALAPASASASGARTRPRRTTGAMIASTKRLPLDQELSPRRGRAGRVNASTEPKAADGVAGPGALEGRGDRFPPPRRHTRSLCLMTHTKGSSNSFARAWAASRSTRLLNDSDLPFRPRRGHAGSTEGSASGVR
jgi:hypothetical protein